MISAKFVALFHSLCTKRRTRIHFEPLSTNFFGVSAIRNGSLAKMSDKSPENPGRFFARTLTSLSTCREVIGCFDLLQTQTESNVVGIEADVCI